jgi:hypothetical protein
VNRSEDATVLRLKICTQNARGISSHSKFEALVDFLDQRDVFACCVQELWTVGSKTKGLCTTDEEEAEAREAHCKNLLEREATYDPKVADLIEQHPAVGR